MSMLNIFASPLSASDEVLKYFTEQQELKCDPLYLGVVIGNVHLQFQKLVKDHEEESKRLIHLGKTPAPLQGIKISFKEDCSVKIEEPGLVQSAQRTILGEGRIELENIRIHIVKLLRWFDCDNSDFKTILKAYKLGLEDILNGYLNKGCKEITISQSPQVQDQQQPIKQVNLKMRTPETQAVIRLLKDDIELLNEAITLPQKVPQESHQSLEIEGSKPQDGKEITLEEREEEKPKKSEKESQFTEFKKQLENERKRQVFKQKLQEEEARYFPMHQLQLIKEGSKTIDKYMEEKVKERWDTKTLKGIVEFLQADSNKAFNRVEALSHLVSKNPAEHLELRNKIRELITSTLANCTITTANDKKEKSN